MRNVKSLDEIKRIMDEKQKLNISVTEFCKQRNIGLRTYYNWIKRINNSNNKSDVFILRPHKEIKDNRELKLKLNTIEASVTFGSVNDLREILEAIKNV